MNWSDIFNMEQEKIDRINELARKARTAEGLTDTERAEQNALRLEYVAAFRESLTAQLDNTYIVEPDGTKHKLPQRGGAKNTAAPGEKE